MLFALYSGSSLWVQQIVGLAGVRNKWRIRLKLLISQIYVFQEENFGYLTLEQKPRNTNKRKPMDNGMFINVQMICFDNPKETKGNCWLYQLVSAQFPLQYDFSAKWANAHKRSRSLLWNQTSSYHVPMQDRDVRCIHWTSKSSKILALRDLSKFWMRLAYENLMYGNCI